jgi:hypothetical protein
MKKVRTALPYPVTVERIEVLDTSHRDRVIADFRPPVLSAFHQPDEAQRR